MILPHPDHLVRVSETVAEPLSVPALTHTRRNEPAGVEAQAELTALVTRAQAGDLAAQSELVLRYQRRLAGQVRLIVRQPAAVEDVV